MSTEPITWALLFFLGLITGVVAGIFGIGGSLVLVPALTLWDLSVVEAAATSLVGVLLSAVSGSVQNWWNGKLNLRVCLQLALFGIPTAFLGATLSESLPDAWLAPSFAAFLLVAIFLVYLRQKVVLETPTDPQDLSSYPGFWPIARIGLVAGVISGFFGIGGGLVLVPLQMILIRQPLSTAVPTSLGAMVAISASGLVQHASRGNVFWIPGLCLGLGGILGAQVGSLLLPTLPEAEVNRAFRMLLLAVAVYMFGLTFQV